MTAILLITAILLVVLTPIIPRFRPSAGVTILAVGMPSFAVLAVVMFRPTAAQLTGLDSTPNAYYLSQPAWITLGAFSIIGVSIYVGALSVRLLFDTPDADQRRLSERVQLELPGTALWICVGALASQIIGVGPGTVLRADTYLAATGPAVLLRIGNALLPVAVIIAANVMFGTRASRGGRAFAALMLAALEVYLFGQATRTFSVFFLLVFAGGWLAGRWTTRQSVARGSVAAVLALVTLGIPLTLRGLPQHGLIPAFEYLASNPVAPFSGDSSPLYNALLGVPLSIFEWRQVPPIGSSALWVSLNPLPGGSSGWNSLAPTLRLNRYEPFSAVGELLNHGWVAVLSVSAALGAIVEALTAVARKSPGRWGASAQAIITGMCGLILIRGTQYNLRTSARLVYYMVFAVVVIAVIARLAGADRSPRSDPAVSASSNADERSWEQDASPISGARG